MNTFQPNDKINFNDFISAIVEYIHANCETREDADRIVSIFVSLVKSIGGTD